jgi:bile acid:Na+ symporter, BASS family
MKHTERVFRLIAALGGVSLAAALIMWSFGAGSWAGVPVTVAFLLLAVGVRGFAVLKGFSFTLSVLAAVSVAMFFPDAIREVDGFNTQRLIVPLLQVIMFGMGTTLSFADFARVLAMPRAVLIGLGCQFSIMPVVGFTIATLFGFPPEIAAGVVLIGSAPGGLASNVMVYLGKGNVALSVTLTAVGTLLAPLLTPMLMRVFAGQFIAVDVLAMMMSIVRMVILPIILGLLFNRVFRGRAEWVHRGMPLVSMAGIAIIIAVITAAGRDHLLTIGVTLVFAAMLHNAAGYTLGYWACALLRMDEVSRRTIAFEVGMQNGGLASGIAAELGRAATLGLAPAVFGPWMNISGSFLANWWRDRPVPQETGGLDQTVRATGGEPRSPATGAGRGAARRGD